jgi:uncharacterized phage protein (TIGR01671 family)
MREIKFRGRRIDNGEWVAGHYLTRRMPEGLRHTISVQDMWGFHDVQPESVGQYTGLQDTNGREIYEGDVTKDEFDRVAIISWKENEARFAMKYIGQKTEYRMFISHLKMEIIGNISENPELLP